MFGFLVETRTVAAIRVFQCSWNGLYFPDSWHKNHTSHLKFVEMPKTFDGSMTVIVTTWAPATRTSVAIGVWRQFGHPKRNSSRRVKKPAPVHRANLRIDILSKVNNLMFRRKTRSQNT